MCHKLSLGYLQFLDLVEIYLYPRPGMVLEVKNLPANARDIRDAGSVPGFGRSPGGGHSNPLSILAWRIPWAEESDGLQSIGSQTVGHN